MPSPDYPLLRLSQGAASLLSGLRKTAGHRSVRRAVVSILLGVSVVALALNVAGFYAAFHFLPLQPSASLWSRLGIWSLRILAILLTLLVSPVLAISLTNLVVPAFSEIPFLAGLDAIAPARARSLRDSPGFGLATSVNISLRRLLPFLLRSLALFALGFIPFIGAPLALLGQLYNGAYTVGWEMLDPFFDKQLVQLAQQKRALKRLHWERLGLGLVCAPLLGLPFIGPLLFASLQAATAQFVVQYFPEETPSSSQPSTSQSPSSALNLESRADARVD